MVRYLNWKAPIGKKFEVHEEKKGTVVGVMKDFNFASLRQTIQPLAILLRNNPLYLSVRLKPGSSAALLSSMEKEWRQLDAQDPFDYFFIDGQMNQFYQGDSRLLTILTIFAGLAIAIACLGLFGISIYQARQRTREIGIRKVLGAGIPGIIGLFAGGTLRLVIIAALVSFPLAAWTINTWLKDFAYRVSVGWWTYPVAALLVVVIALVTVGFQALKAAKANPVKSLHTE
jgi:putative ABC transport system permease protein